MTRWLTWILLICAVAIVAMLSLVADKAIVSGDLAAPQVADALRRTAPPDATNVTAPVDHRNLWSVTSTWRIDVTLACGDYLAWVAPRLEPDYSIVAREPSGLTCVRRAAGDAYTIILECTTTAVGAHVAVTFIARAD